MFIQKKKKKPVQGRYAYLSTRAYKKTFVHKRAFVNGQIIHKHLNKLVLINV